MTNHLNSRTTAQTRDNELRALENAYVEGKIGEDEYAAHLNELSRKYAALEAEYDDQSTDAPCVDPARRASFVTALTAVGAAYGFTLDMLQADGDELVTVGFVSDALTRPLPKLSVGYDDNRIANFHLFLPQDD